MSYSHFAVPQALEYYENDEFDLGQRDHFDLDLSPQFYGNWTMDLEQDTSIDDYALYPLAYEVDWLSNPTTSYGLASPSSPFPYPLSSGADALNGASSYFNERQSPASPSAQTVYSATTSSSGKASTATRKKKAAYVPFPFQVPVYILLNLHSGSLLWTMGKNISCQTSD